MELELKLALLCDDPVAVTERLCLPDMLGCRPTRHQHLRNLYFDTPDAQLARARMALRLRGIQTPQGTRWRQTLKTSGQEHSALSERGEWENDLDSDRLDPLPLRGTPWDRFDPDGTVWASLVPVFETNFDRSAWVLETPDGSQVELALDAGRILANERTAPIAEIELELLHGHPAALFDLAERLGHQLPVLPDPFSKAHRGHALAQDRLHHPVPPKPEALSGDLLPHTAAPTLIGAASFQFLAHLHVLRHRDCTVSLAHALEGWHAMHRNMHGFSPWTGDIPLACLSALSPLVEQLQNLNDRHAAVHQLVPELIRNVPAQSSHWQALAVALERETPSYWTALRLAMAQPDTGLALLGLTRWQHELPSRLQITD